MDVQKLNLEESIAELDKLVESTTNDTAPPDFTLITEKLKALQENFPESENLAEALARILFNLSTKQTELKELEATAEKLQILQEQFHDSHDIALQYARILFNLSTKQTELKELEATAEKLEKLQQQFQESHDIAEALAMILFNLSLKQTELKELEWTVEKLQTLQEQFHDSHDMALAYAKILVNLSTEQTELKELEWTAEKLEKLHERFSDSLPIAEAFANILFNLSIEQTEANQMERISEKLQKLLEKFSDSLPIAEVFAMFLFNLSTKQTEANQMERTAEKLEKLHERFSDSLLIAEAFSNILFNVSLKQTELKELEWFVEKLQILQEQFHDSPDMALAYAKILVNLSTKQTELKELEWTAEKLEKLHERFSDSLPIAEAFAMILFNLSLKQTELKELEWTVEKLQILQEQFQKSEIIAFIYAMFLAGLSDHQAKLGKRLQIIGIIKNLYEQFPKFMLQHFDDLFFHNDNVCDNEEYRLFDFVLKEGLLKNTKYAILENWVRSYDEDSEKLNTLLSIYQYVQKIKYQLGLKVKEKNSNLKFGHYTKGSTLQVMLDQEENEKKKNTFSVSGKTRLYNANYMNDPEEGIVIEKILGIDRRDILEPSSWFLMSFTSKTDDLAMWSQYGDDAKGVCLVLREDDFSRFTSFNDVSWRKEATPIVETMNTIESTLSYDLKSSPNELNNIKPTIVIKDEEKRSKSGKKENVPKGNRDYLYRIAYVKNIDKDIDEDIELEQTELFSNSEIEDLAKMLNSLKKKLDSGSKVKEENYQNAISECIEEIRYLFKSVDYKYENELRILRYANLDPSNKEIKIDKTSGVGKLYVERKNSIQIGEVIFGPKFPNPEYVTPLLKLLDENIDYKKSTIKFR